MARSRNIKPGFFKNEQLADCSPLSRLLFAGLWCLADREGRLEDRPKRIRAEILPYDDGSVDEMLDELHNNGFINRYANDGQGFIQVVNFLKHQNPHCKEQASLIPAPDKYGASTVQEQDNNQKSIEQARLIPDSLNLIPDSLKPVPLSNDNGYDQATPALANCPHEKIIALYAKHLPGLPQPRSWEGQRVKDMRARWRWVLTAKDPCNGERWAEDEGKALRVFEAFFMLVAKSEFLTGRSGKWSGCNLHWLMKAENFNKVFDGVYDNGESK